LGGAWYELGVKGGFPFQPLRDVDDEGARLWARSIGCVACWRMSALAITPEVKETIWSP